MNDDLKRALQGTRARVANADGNNSKTKRSGNIAQGREGRFY
eukprot:COSAG02_NODE_567_length_20212_cov_18.927460_22_plen_42_part_00